MSVLYVSALFSTYRPLKFGNSFYPGGLFKRGLLYIDMDNAATMAKHSVKPLLYGCNENRTSP